MDLFNQADSKLYQRMNGLLGSWANHFDSFTLEGLSNILRKLEILYKSVTVYPDKFDVLRLYRELPPKKVKVVILGQDPYHDGNANGVAFACKKSLTPSMIKLLSGLVKDVDNEREIPREFYSLERWVAQGVFPLNTILTVEAGYALSHESLGWQHFTAETVKILAKQSQPIVWMLWGGKAKAYKRFVTNHKHLVLECEHPASAGYNQRDWICNHFSLANKYFKQCKQKEIKWI